MMTERLRWFYHLNLTDDIPKQPPESLSLALYLYSTLCWTISRKNKRKKIGTDGVIYIIQVQCYTGSTNRRPVFSSSQRRFLFCVSDIRLANGFNLRETSTSPWALNSAVPPCLFFPHLAVIFLLLFLYSDADWHMTETVQSEVTSDYVSTPTLRRWFRLRSVGNNKNSNRSSYNLSPEELLPKQKPLKHVN